jgi:hypothetical protein
MTRNTESGSGNDATSSAKRARSAARLAIVLPNYGLYTQYQAPGREKVLPNDFESVKERMLRPRPSLSPSDESIQRVLDTLDKNLSRAPNEAAVKDAILPMFQLDVSPPNFCSAKEVYMNSYEPLMRSKNRFAKPDMYDGAVHGSVPAPVHEPLRSVIVPSSAQLEYPILPNLSFEIKGRAAAYEGAHTQVLLGCAYGARGMHALLCLTHEAQQGTSARGNDSGAEAVYGKTLAFGAAFTVNILTLYTMHMSPCPPAHPYFSSSSETPRPLVEYHLSKLLEIVLTSSPEAYCTGVAAVLNLRELAYERRQEAIQGAHALMEARQQRPMPPPLTFVLLQQGDKPKAEASTTELQTTESQTTESQTTESQTTEDTTDEGSQQSRSSSKRRLTGHQGGGRKRNKGGSSGHGRSR